MSGPANTADRRPAAREPAHPVYVYGVIPAAAAGDWAETTGLDGPTGTVRIVADGDLAALVSDLAPGHTPGRRDDLDAHRAVLARAIEHCTALPMRFGIVMDGDEAVREQLLRRHHDELERVLRAVDGHVQMMVKAFYADDALLRDVLARRPELARQSEALRSLPEAEARAARVRLGELIANAVEARRGDVESALVAELEPYVADMRVEPAGSDRVAFGAEVLVRRDRRDALDERIRSLAASLAGLMAFRYVGPLPPYSFADVSLEEDAPPWD
jgi:Gas vesicle synthesis protein GvpL/GvpF